MSRPPGSGATGSPEPLRPPLQTRSRQSLERVLDAGQELLEELGWEGFTVQEVSRRARVSVGSIYARATSKEALIFAIYDRATDRVAAETVAALAPTEMWSGFAARELIIGASEELAAQLLKHELILRVFMNRAQVDEAVRDRGTTHVRRIAKRYQELLLLQEDAVTHRHPDVAIEVAFRIVFSAVARRISLGPQFGAYRAVGDQELVDELGRAVAAYLLEPVLHSSPVAEGP